MKLIINSDDFGFSKNINKGIIESLYDGLISTTTVMISLDDAKDAMTLWKENEKEIRKKNPQNHYGLGLHFNITKEKSLLSLESLCDKNGNFLKRENLEKEKFIREDVYKELDSQVQEFLSYGVMLDHFDCHHPIHANEIVRNVTLSLAKKYNSPLRSEHPLLTKLFKSEGIKTTASFLKNFSNNNAKRESIIKFLSENNSVESLEIMTHLGFMDDETKKRTTYINRDNEINELRKLKEEGFYKNFNLCCFRDL